MTTTAATPPGAPTDAPTSARWGRERMRRTGMYVGAVAVALLVVVLLSLSAERPTAPLDPEGVGPEGARALAEVLRSQGVQVDVVRSIDDLEAAEIDADSTVFVGDPTYLGPEASTRLAAASADAGRLVVLGLGSEQLKLLGLPLQAFEGGGPELVARCDSQVARTDDVVTAWDTRYTPSDGSNAAGGPDASGTTSCFVVPSPDGPPDQPDPEADYGAAMMQLEATSTHPAVVVAGLGPAWSNGQISSDSHAGTAVRALGSTPRLVWYQPSVGDLVAPSADGEEPSGDLSVWPAWTTPAALLLGVAVVLLALTRGRRLGRLVREPLPVVVRAIETTESRGRLYRRSGDRGRAAAVLRSGSAQRLTNRLGVGRGAPPAALVTAVSSATGQPAAEVADILFGPPPPDDSALIHLAQQLTDLEERVRHP